MYLATRLHGVYRVTVTHSLQAPIELYAKIRVEALNPELNPISLFLALLGAHHILHVSRIRVKSVVQESSGHHYVGRDFTKKKISSSRLFY